MAPTTPSASTSASSKGKGIPRPRVPKDKDGDDKMNTEETSDEEDDKHEITKLREENMRLSQDLVNLGNLSRAANDHNNARFEAMIQQMETMGTNASNNAAALQATINAMEQRTTGLSQELANAQAEQARRAEQANGFSVAPNIPRPRDIGETIKPQQPREFDGSPKELAGHLTELKSYHMYYPTAFSSNPLKVRHAMGLLKGDAKDGMAPILKDFVEKAPEERKPETTTLFDSFEAYEQMLRNTYGEWDEKHDALIAIRKLHQHKAASEYLTKFRYLAAKLNWTDENMIDSFYEGLKDEVKDEICKILDLPTDFNSYTRRCVMIDNRLFERRMEKQKGGNTSGWKKKNNYNSNSGKKRQGNTSYGTAAGPMELGAAQRDHSQVQCWNCGKKGHFESKCRGPKTNQKHKPVPEGNRKVRFTGKDEDVQTAIRTTKTRTIAMTRSGYDGGFNGAYQNLGWEAYQDPDQKAHDLSWEEECLAKEATTPQPRIRRPQKPIDDDTEEKASKRAQWHRQMDKETPLEKRARLDKKKASYDRGRARKQQSIRDNWGPVPVPDQTSSETTSRTIAMVRAGSSKNRDDDSTIPDGQPKLATPPPTHQEYGANLSERQEKNDELRRRFYAKEEGKPWVHAGREARKARKMGLPVNNGDIIPPAIEYPESEDECHCEEASHSKDPCWDLQTSREHHWEKDTRGTRMWKNPMEMYDDLAEERQNPDEDEPVYIRAYDRYLGRNTLNITPMGRPDDDPRVSIHHQRHEEISWASCVIHACQTHEKEKIYHNCYPVRTSNKPIKEPYLQEELKYFRVTKWYSGAGVAQLDNKGNLFPPGCMASGATLGDCETEECRIHEQEKLREWHSTEHERKTRCVATKALRCDAEDCEDHKWEIQDEFQRIKYMMTKNYEFNNHRGTSSLDRAWKSKMEDWERRGMSPDCEDEVLARPAQSCLARDAMTCTLPGCPKHGIKAQEINQRIRRMHMEGFNFHDRTGDNKDDQAWYRQLRESGKDPRRL
jgi:hypothetical protein